MTRANLKALEYQFEPEIERVCRRNQKEFRAMTDPPNNRNAANNNQIAAAGGGNPPLAIPPIQVQNRSIRDHLLLDLGNLNPGIVTPEIQAAQFELKPVMFNMLNSIGQFGGSPHEDARQHLRSFIEVCDSFRQQGVHEDVLRLKLFPYSLRDRARLWFNSIPSRSVESWDELCRNCIIRYSSTVMTDKLRNDITSFRQTDDESMYEAWDRYKELFRKCPMHGFNEWTKVIMFYNGVNAPTRMMLDASANGTLLDKSTEEEIEILDRLANNDYQFPSTRRGMARRNGTTYELEPTDSVSAQLAALTNMVKNLQRPSSSQEVKVIASYCDLCNVNYDFFECPQNPESSFYVGNFNRNNNPYSNTYNPGWKQHPNFSWNNQRNPSNTIRQNAEASGSQQNMSRQQNQLPQQQPPSTSSLENSLNAFIHRTESYMADTTKFMGRTDSFINMTEIRMQSQEAALKSLETQVGQFAQMLSARPQGNLPSNTEVARRTGHEQCKVITTRSGVKAANETIQDEENESPKVTETDLYGTSTQEDVVASPNVVASSSHNAKLDEVSKGKEIHPPPPFPQRLRKQKYEYQFKKFLDILKQVNINLPLVEAIEQMPNYAKFLKDMVSKRTRLTEFETVAMTEGCMAMLHNRLPPKLKDLGSFTIPCATDNHYVGKALCDLGASINLMPKLVFQRLGIGKARPTTVMLQLADRSYVHPEGKIEDILQVTINIFKSLKQPDDPEECQTISAYSKFNFEVEDVDLDKILVEASKIKEAEFEDDEPQKVNWIVNRPRMNFESLDLSSTCFKPNKPSIEQPPDLELKPLPEQLKYVYLGNDDTLPVIISSKLQHEQEKQLINMMARHKKAIGWTIVDIKRISPAICSHKILLEEGHNNSIEAQRRLNPTMKQVVMKEIIKWLDAGIIFPISDSAWVSPIQCVPKKGGMTVVSNEKNELIPTRTVTGWRVCMDYRKLNKATRKDHFPLPFINQMLDRLAGKSFYCFLDGYSGYNQISIAQEDQEKTTFTCPFGTYAFRRMPFGLCNAPATFQRCMMAIFSDMVEDFLEIFMDDFSVFGDNFDTCLSNLEKDKVFNFDESCAKAFEDLKKQLASAPIVHSPDWSLPFELMCDASEFAVRAVLGQRERKVFHVVYYASKILNDAQLNYTTIEKELLAVVFAFDKFRPYLIGTKVIVHTDHSAIKYLLAKKDAKPRLIRWILLLQEFDVEIKDRKGTKNQIADHLSRLEGGDAHDNHFEIHDAFPDEQLLLAVATPWYADIVNFLIRSYEGVFPKMNNKMYSYNVIHHPMEVILEAHAQQPKFYNQAFIGLPFLKMPITSTRGVIDAKEQGISQDGMRCHCRIYLRLSFSTFGG
ncbi:hypothetical protein GQ457_02G030500 [Hibiscus cannabinus]